MIVQFLDTGFRDTGCRTHDIKRDALRMTLNEHIKTLAIPEGQTIKANESPL